MTQYLLSVHHSPDAPPPPPEEMQKAFRQVDEFNEELKTAGAWVFGGGLHPPSIATVVRVEDGEAIVTDGPFAETKEHLGGFWIITAPDLDAALAWATKGSTACMGPVEVRPFQDDEPES
ncbi:MAG: YciI family protein [Actinomycetota bacterium]|nr:YciI family protein [Actinomycetota bacterium]